MIQRLYTITGYELYAFNATMEHGIPSLWVIAKNTREHGMNVVCAGGSHLDPVRALKSAIHEIAGMLLITDDELEQKESTTKTAYKTLISLAKWETIVCCTD